MNSRVRTRFAPSPTGYLHVGGARTALFNYLFARQQGGTFVLRIEDTDHERNTDAARAAIFSGMSWLGLDWDEGEGKGGDFGPYNQSERQPIYEKWFDQLKTSGRVYEDEGAWRFRFERRLFTFTDLVCGEITIDYTDESINPDMVIRRSDGTFVFHFVNVVDDLEMQITHVIRGEDHLMNTPKHLQLFEALGVEPPAYAHIPLIQNPNGSKMSKRDEGAALGDYQAKGFVPAAVVNFLALLGWSSKDDKEIFSIEDLIERFSIAAINRSPAKFDLAKCQWMNQQHLAQLSTEAFAQLAAPFVEAENFPINDSFPRIAASIQEKVSLLSEVPKQVAFFYQQDFPIAEDALTKVRQNPEVAGLMSALAQEFSTTNEWSADSAKHAIQACAVAHQIKPGALMFPTRVALSGQAGGPDLGEILAILGQPEATRRVLAFAHLLTQSA